MIRGVSATTYNWCLTVKFIAQLFWTEVSQIIKKKKEYNYSFFSLNSEWSVNSDFKYFHDEIWCKITHSTWCSLTKVCLETTSVTERTVTFK